MSQAKPTLEVGTVPDTEEMAHRSAIAQVLAVHCRGVDRASEADLKSAYWPDATVAYGGFNGNAHEFCAHLPAGIRKYAATQHSISSCIMTRHGPVAAVETYVTAYHYRANEDEPDEEMTYIGRYLDRFELRDNVWKIAHRQVCMDWNQNDRASAILEGPPFDGLARGARAPEDPLYALLASVAAD